MKLIQIFLVLVFSGAALAADLPASNKLPKRRPASSPKALPLYIGHNQTQSTDVLRARTVTLGNYAAGIGITDKLFVATSPWILYSYNTMNLHLKYSEVLNSHSTVGVMASYFDSYDSGKLLGQQEPSLSGPGTFAANGLPTGATVAQGTNRYQWTSYSVNGLYSYQFDSFTQYFNLKYSYFVNDEMPYSLRMDPGDDSIRDQVDVSTLLKMPLDNAVSLALEGGVLGLNYVQPYAHMGASVAVQENGWLVQLGASYTVGIYELGTDTALEVGRMDQRVHYSETAGQFYTERYLQVAVHPEIQVQFSF